MVFKEEYIVNAIPISNMIAMCHIIDEYPIFSENLKRFVQSKNNRNDIYNLWKISNNKKVKGSRKVKRFYQDNKNAINIINRYTTLNSFICYNYDSKGNLKDNSRIDLFYEYLIKHKDEVDRILLVLDRISNLDFRSVYFDENIAFSNDTYKININGDNSEILYLDNMEALPSYHIDSVEYRTNNSNYGIILKSFMYGNLFSQYIVVNSLLFDPNRLPNEISIEGLTNKIINLKENQEAFNRVINNSVSLNNGINDLYRGYLKACDTIDDLEGIKNKEELKEYLLMIRKYLDKLIITSKEYDNNIIKEYQGINREGLEEEKKKANELLRKKV